MTIPNSENPAVINCPRCGAPLLDNASYCGKCGRSITDSCMSCASVGSNAGTSEEKSLWQWISPAIGLWAALLAINGVLGLCGHIFDISSPYFDLGAQVVSILFILIPCVKAREQLKSLLSGFGYRGFFRFFEIIGALIFVFVFMRLYFKMASFIGIEELSYLADFRKHSWPIWSAFILICLLPGVFEEIAFRGYIMSRLEKVGNTGEALIIQAAMFSVLHMSPVIFISHFVIGLILGAVRLRSGSLYPGMLIHIAWNSIVIMGEVYKAGA